MAQSLTTKEFITKARKVHGDKYDYSKVIYVNSTTKVTIICPIHGEFQQNPPDHTNNRSGCYYCGIESLKRKQRSTKEEFVKKAKKVHGDYYDYGKVVYINNKTVVEIICPEHGSFWQIPANHLYGKGCIKCGFKKTADGLRSSLEQFLQKAEKVHGGWYFYELVEYVNSKSKVKVICPEHGLFEVSPDNHLRGKGCPSCGLLKIAETSRRHMTGKTPPNKMSLDNFIKKARIVHDNQYSYENADLIDVKKKIVITCPEHGDFEQRPDHHLQGVGCPKCNQSKGEREINILLDRWKIKYDIQANLHKNFKFDFFLPDFKMVIEYHGIQHYKPIEFFGGERGLLSNQRRDAAKKAYCKGNGIYYFEVPYDTEDIENYLEKEFARIVNRIEVKSH